MGAHTLDTSVSVNYLTDKLCHQISEKYDVDPRLASEMACDLVELLSAINSDLDTLDRFFLG